MSNKNLELEVTFYLTDESFDYGDFTCYQTGLNGFSIEATIDDELLIDTLQGYGELTDEIKDIKTLKDLYQYCVDNLQYTDEYGRAKVEDFINTWKEELNA